MLPLLPDGPIIPQPVLEALAEDRLVFFCGAGISMGTQLPDFKGLVTEVYRLLNEDEMSAPERVAYGKEQYDKVLGLLEERTRAGELRRR